MKISFNHTFIVQNFKNSHFPPNNYKGIVLKIGVQNYPFFSFMILLSSKTLKALIPPPPNNYKGIVLKNEVQNGLF